jgi:hypothetical protein
MAIHLKNKFYIFLIIQIGVVTALTAQKLDTVDVWLDTNKIVKMPYAVADNDWNLQATKLTDKSYPVAIIPQLAFKQILTVNKQRLFVGSSLQTKIDFLEKKDSLSTLEINHLNKYIQLQKTQIADCDSLNTRLNRSITSLSGQLDKSLDLTVSVQKHNRWQKIGYATIGTVLGLSAGLLIGALR